MKRVTRNFIIECLDKDWSLKPYAEQIEASIRMLVNCFRNGGKLLICGCGGSAADSEHIAGELLKSFKYPRDLDDDFCAKYESMFGCDEVVARLEGGLPAISLSSMTSAMTAIANDIGGDMIYAQQVYSLATPKDVIIAISTSGYSRLVLPAVKVAKAKGAKVIGMTGKNGGKLATICDVTIVVDEEETFHIQEYHQELYHVICGAVELEIYAN